MMSATACETRRKKKQTKKRGNFRKKQRNESNFHQRNSMNATIAGKLTFAAAMFPI
jgi:hypothetical protein